MDALSFRREIKNEMAYSHGIHPSPRPNPIAENLAHLCRENKHASPRVYLSPIALAQQVNNNNDTQTAAFDAAISTGGKFVTITRFIVITILSIMLTSCSVFMAANSQIRRI